jgi:hypothetical protein
MADFYEGRSAKRSQGLTDAFRLFLQTQGGG